MSMKDISIGKVTLNIGIGAEADQLPKAQKILEMISKKKVVITYSKKRSTFNIAKGRKMGVKITLRKKPAEDLLKTLLGAKDNKLPGKSFDSSGNFSFGIEEYINIPGIKYDPEIGIMGLDVCVTLERPGYRVKKRQIRPVPIGKAHRITKEDAVEFAKSRLGVKIV